jgi:hypothetical protein
MSWGPQCTLLGAAPALTMLSPVEAGKQPSVENGGYKKSWARNLDREIALLVDAPSPE